MSVETEATPAATTETPVETAAPAGKSNHVLETAADGPDPDQVELDAALAEEKAFLESKAAEAPATTETTTETPATDTPAAAAPAAAAPADQPQLVPVTALQAERAARQVADGIARKSVETAAYWKGVAEGRFPDPGIRADVVPDRIKEIRGKQKELAAQVDKGTLSTEEYEDQRQALEDQIHDVRQEETLAKVREVVPAAGNDLYLQTLTSDLERKHEGWLNNVPSDEIENLIPFARKELAAAGYDMSKINGTPLGDYRLREAVVSVAQKFGFDKLYGTQAAPAAAAAPGGVIAKPTPEQLAEKNRIAANAPPAPVGQNAPSQGLNEERIESMSSLDLENLPMSQLKQISDNLDREVAGKRTAVVTRR